MGWSQFYSGENSIQIKIVEPGNLLSLVIKAGKAEKQPGNSIFDISYISVLLIFVLMYNDHDTDCDIDNDINHK